MDSTKMRALLGLVARNFVRGLAITVPVVFTVYLAWVAITGVDAWLGLPIPGAGLLIILTAITIIGAFATNVVTRAAIATLDQLFEKLPLIRLFYTTAKDLMHAFVGEKKRFTKAVRVRPDPAMEVWFLGFVTADDMARLGLPGYVAVYLPQSYNIAGNLILVPGDRVVALAVDSADLMAFIVSGGVTGTAVTEYRDLPPRLEHPPAA